MVEQRKNLIKYRLGNAREKLDSAKILLDNGNYKDSYIVSVTEAREQIEKAEELLEIIKVYLEVIFKEEEL